MLDPEIAFWTSRGIGVVDVNYGGSTGFGRAYRELLNGAWGIVDVEDCIAAARAPRRARARPTASAWPSTAAAPAATPPCARSPSTTTSPPAPATTAWPTLETLAADTHKFESRYLDSLIGPYPEAAQTYRSARRSTTRTGSARR